MLENKFLFVYCEEIKPDLNRILIYECRCDERLKAKAERSTRLASLGNSLGCGEDMVLFIIRVKRELNLREYIEMGVGIMRD